MWDFLSICALEGRGLVLLQVAGVASVSCHPYSWVESPLLGNLLEHWQMVFVEQTLRSITLDLRHVALPHLSDCWQLLSSIHYSPRDVPR